MSQTKTQLVEGLNINTSAPADALAVANDGDVGIGTTSPNYKLHLHSATTGDSNYLQITHADAGSGASDGLQLGLATGSSPDAYLAQKENGALIFQTNAQNRARIDSSGRLLVGSSTNNASYKLQVVHSNSGVLLGCFDGGVNYLSTLSSNGSEASKTIVSSNQELFQINATGYDGSSNRTAATISAQVDGTPGSSNMPGCLIFSTNGGTTSTTERMRINMQGAAKFTTNGTYASAGNTRHEFTNSAGSQETLYLRHTATSNPYGITINYTGTNPNNAASEFAYFYASGLKFSVKSNGGINNYQSNDSNLCDEREKKNIVNLDSTWDCLKHWELKKFHYNEDADDADLRYGVIAQQVAPHCPEVISDWVKQRAEDAVLDEDGNVVTPAKEEIVRMGVKEQQMYWMAIRALQEAQTRIETLETANASQATTIATLDARLTALEGAG